ncbi:MAG: hypothetical protein ACRBCI_14245 [Cellvibrionaceae bacterium]
MKKPVFLRLNLINFFALSLFFLFTPFFSSLSVANNKVETIWWEAENFDSGFLPVSGPLSPENNQQASLLSNGQWVNRAKEKEAIIYKARYKLKIKKSNNYYFYIRKHWYHDKFRYRFNQGPWRYVNRAYFATLKGSVILKEDLRVDWLNLPVETLKAGNNLFELELTGTDKTTAIDAFVLSSQPFEPMGLRSPGEKLNRADKDFWSFEPASDAFSDTALWNLRSLNETIAGKNGYIKLSDDGNSFTLANGEAVRFWSINTNIVRSHSQQEHERHARSLAKRGFNMVRFHGAINSKTADLMQADVTEIEKSWRLVATMKKQGIYTTLSPYWGTHTPRQKQWISITKGNPNNLAGLVFFEPTVQKAYKSWLKQWLTSVNPYTNIPLALDPAVAMLQIQNEDSLLFWTQRSIQGEQLALLEKRFSEWLLKKYGSFANLKKQWKNNKETRDDFKRGHIAIVDIRELTQQFRGAKQQRISDQYQFLIETMRDWNQEVERFLREEVGYQGLINAGNWRTADNVRMLDGERWSYTANQVMAVNRYYSGGVHINPKKQSRTGYRITNGDLFQSQSALFNPRKLPVNIKQVDGFPMIVSESTWSGPQHYQSEAPFLVSAYSSLSGLDSYYWFSTSTESFDTGLVKFPASSPSLMASYPAAALMFRKAYVREGQPVIEEHRSLHSIWQREEPLMSEESGFDPNRDKGLLNFLSANKSNANPLAFLVGPVVSHYNSDPQKTRLAKLDDYINQEQGQIKSITNELIFDYKNGLSTINAEKAQGVTGFLNKKKDIVLDDFSIKTTTPYATIMLVSLDENAINKSKRLLLQITTQSQPYQYKEEPAVFTNPHKPKDKTRYTGYRLIDQGTVPMTMRHHAMEMVINNKFIKRATMTDINGYALQDVTLDTSGKAVKLRPPSDAVYIILSDK